DYYCLILHDNSWVF
nr:immunoglobulin light chain junction region [Macaca mulatta]MOY05779.1 immunoglobulin light chain junction region [Macaca mulatta]MOY08520.1 immunoglobulin light chain junction region [Macaca mulatta]MOY08724.1 immunoglobulin light chain junction region [Macaca mulatta]MOY09049.1 immunoglobulin light chain junction region [Macaca mulatta]